MAQFGAVTFIDEGEGASGITGIVSADLDNDGFLDLITSNGYNQGRVTWYHNDQGSLENAAPVIIDLNASFVEGVAVGDLDQDGWIDVVAITRYEGELIWYRNSSGEIIERLVLDSGMVLLNAVAIGDVDGNGSPDLVVIGQHSIDLFRNDGTGQFTKEAILTTSSSPLPLECMDLVLADMDGDGDLDAVTAETIGPVIYMNDGVGLFTPELVDPQPAIQQQIDVDDVDGDGDPDIVVVSFLGGARWYRNDGVSWMEVGSILEGTPIRGFDLFHADGDGFADAVCTRGSQVFFQRGLGDGTFTPSVSVFSLEGSLMDAVCTTDLNNDGGTDLIWSAPAGQLAYHLYELGTGAHQIPEPPPFTLVPDPGGRGFIIQTQQANIGPSEVIDIQGRVVLHLASLQAGDLLPTMALPTGIYLLRTRSGILRFLSASTER